MNLSEVYGGLIRGKSFKRPLEGGGFEYLRPVFPLSLGLLCHTVAGESNGGWGGQADLPRTILNNGRWDYNGWVETED
jgi:hypothetical protein